MFEVRFDNWQGSDLEEKFDNLEDAIALAKLLNGDGSEFDNDEFGFFVYHNGKVVYYPEWDNWDL